MSKVSEAKRALTVELEFSRARPELIAFSHFIRAVSAIQSRVSSIVASWWKTCRLVQRAS